MSADAEDMSLPVYLSLLTLTAVTVGCYFLRAPRSLAVTLAFGIASVKAGLIGLYFMRLKEARPLVHAILLVALAAVAILAVGLMPDVALYPA